MGLQWRAKFDEISETKIKLTGEIPRVLTMKQQKAIIRTQMFFFPTLNFLAPDEFSKEWTPSEIKAQKAKQHNYKRMTDR